VTTSLESMIEKRWPAPGWCVLWEVANGTGWKTKRHADAVAIGIWPSHGYAIHGIEIKRSRGDLMKELGDPSKADAVGAYCDHWWLVLADEKIASGVELPPTWGVLAPKNQLLRVVRKAPERKPKPVDRSFFAALVRNVMSGYVPRHEHDQLAERQHDEVRKELEESRQYTRERAELDLENLRARVAAFEEASGIQLEPYNSGRIGDAVRKLLEIRDMNAGDASARHASQLDTVANTLEYAAERARAAAKTIREVAAIPAEQLQLPAVPALPD
jgi:hypothetical protein